MGYLTTFTIYNDGISEIVKKSKDFCKNLFHYAIDGKVSSFGHGFHANLVKVQKTRHADDHTIYVHMGNTLCEMNRFSNDTLGGMARNQEFYEEMIVYMEWQIEGLREKLDGQKGFRKPMDNGKNE